MCVILALLLVPIGGCRLRLLFTVAVYGSRLRGHLRGLMGLRKQVA